jgi:hypothetical protein
MFCDRCGAPLQPNQRFCGQCGRDFSGTPASLAPSRVREHIRFIAILWLALSVLNVIAGFVLLVVSTMLFPHLHEMGAPPQVPTDFLTTLLGVIAVAVLAKAAAGLLAGWGLYQREPWARMLTIVLSFVALLNFPLGTALGIYSLWVLLPVQSERDYEQEARAAEAM